MKSTDWVQLGDERGSYRMIFIVQAVVAACAAYNHSYWAIAYGVIACLHMAAWRMKAAKIQYEFDREEDQ